jgi:hypothetical protein
MDKYYYYHHHHHRYLLHAGYLYIYCIHVNNHCHRVTAQLQLNK